jgi:hypothetical protein
LEDFIRAFKFGRIIQILGFNKNPNKTLTLSITEFVNDPKEIFIKTLIQNK